jgi:hypothetical protein
MSARQDAGGVKTVVRTGRSESGASSTLTYAGIVLVIIARARASTVFTSTNDLIVLTGESGAADV